MTPTTLRVLSLRCTVALAQPVADSLPMAQALRTAFGQLLDAPPAQAKARNGQVVHVLRGPASPVTCRVETRGALLDIPCAAMVYAEPVTLREQFGQMAIFAECIAQWPLGRVGVAGFFFADAEDPAGLIGRKYIKGNVAGKLSELSLRYNMPSTLDSISINNVTTLNDGWLKSPAQPQRMRGVALIRDINTADNKTPLATTFAPAFVAKCQGWFAEGAIRKYIA